MRILVTGASGQVGAALVPRLRTIATVIPTNLDTLDFLKTDLPAALDRIAPDMIVNPAAYTLVDQAEAEPETAMAINATAVGTIARWAALHGVPLIHFSTDYVFNGAGEAPWRETDLPQPLSVYGASKLAGDKEVLAAGGCALILRTSWVYSATGKNFLRTIARLARERVELRVVADQIGAPTSAALLADLISKIVGSGTAAVRRDCGRANGLVHAAASGETSWHGFASAIVEGLKARGVNLAVKQVVPIRTDQYPTAAKRPHNSRLDLSRLREVFGLVPISWQTALAAELDELARELL